MDDDSSNSSFGAPSCVNNAISDLSDFDKMLSMPKPSGKVNSSSTYANVGIFKNGKLHFSSSNSDGKQHDESEADARKNSNGKESESDVELNASDWKVIKSVKKVAKSSSKMKPEESEIEGTLDSDNKAPKKQASKGKQLEIKSKIKTKKSETLKQKLEGRSNARSPSTRNKKVESDDENCTIDPKSRSQKTKQNRKGKNDTDGAARRKSSEDQLSDIDIPKKNVSQKFKLSKTNDSNDVSVSDIGRSRTTKQKGRQHKNMSDDDVASSPKNIEQRSKQKKKLESDDDLFDEVDSSSETPKGKRNPRNRQLDNNKNTSSGKQQSRKNTPVNAKQAKESESQDESSDVVSLKKIKKNRQHKKSLSDVESDTEDFRNKPSLKTKYKRKVELDDESSVVDSVRRTRKRTRCIKFSSDVENASSDAGSPFKNPSLKVKRKGKFESDDESSTNDSPKKTRKLDKRKKVSHKYKMESDNESSDEEDSSWVARPLRKSSLQKSKSGKLDSDAKTTRQSNENKHKKFGNNDKNSSSKMKSVRKNLRQVKEDSSSDESSHRSSSWKTKKEKVQKLDEGLLDIDSSRKRPRRSNKPIEETLIFISDASDGEDLSRINSSKKATKTISQRKNFQSEKKAKVVRISRNNSSSSDNVLNTTPEKKRKPKNRKIKDDLILDSGTIPMSGLAKEMVKHTLPCCVKVGCIPVSILDKYNVEEKFRVSSAKFQTTSKYGRQKLQNKDDILKPTSSIQRKRKFSEEEKADDMPKSKRAYSKAKQEVRNKLIDSKVSNVKDSIDEEMLESSDSEKSDKSVQKTRGKGKAAKKNVKQSSIKATRNPVKAGTTSNVNKKGKNKEKQSKHKAVTSKRKLSHNIVSEEECESKSDFKFYGKVADMIKLVRPCAIFVTKLKLNVTDESDSETYNASSSRNFKRKKQSGVVNNTEDPNFSVSNTAVIYHDSDNDSIKSVDNLKLKVGNRHEDENRKTYKESSDASESLESDIREKHAREITEETEQKKSADSKICESDKMQLDDVDLDSETKSEESKLAKKRETSPADTHSSEEEDLEGTSKSKHDKLSKERELSPTNSGSFEEDKSSEKERKLKVGRRPKANKVFGDRYNKSPKVASRVKKIGGKSSEDEALTEDKNVDCITTDSSKSDSKENEAEEEALTEERNFENVPVLDSPKSEAEENEFEVMDESETNADEMGDFVVVSDDDSGNKDESLNDESKVESADSKTHLSDNDGEKTPSNQQLSDKELEEV